MCRCCVNLSISQIEIEFFNCCGKLVYLRNGFCCVQVLEGFFDEEKKGCGFVRDLVSGLSMGVREREGEGGEKEDEDKLMFPGFACFLEKMKIMMNNVKVCLFPGKNIPSFCLFVVIF